MVPFSTYLGVTNERVVGVLERIGAVGGKNVAGVQEGCVDRDTCLYGGAADRLGAGKVEMSAGESGSTRLETRRLLDQPQSGRLDHRRNAMLCG